MGAYVDWLYLRPGNSDIVYAVEVTGPDPVNDSPTGPTGINQMGFASGVRVGGFFTVGDCSRLDISYTWYQTDDQNTIQAAAGTVLDLQVAHPSRATSGVGSAMATADQDLTMQLVDLDYQDLINQSSYGSLGYRIGVRYGRLEQGFMAQQDIFAGAGLTTVASDIDYDGVGIRMGLDYERLAASSGFLLYAKGTASFLAGELKADYRQTNQFGGSAVIGNSLQDYRILSILDAEAGIGWQDCSGRYRVTAGYIFSGWFNALTNGAYIEAVQTATNGVQRPGTYNDVAETFTLSGLTVRGEFRF
jgi:Legionella pneumophila major outer membrane protein precursor